jgi:hypothetical protein
MTDLTSLAPLFPVSLRAHWRADGRPKRGFTRHEARLARREMRREGLRGLSIYVCPVCGRDHVGHRR